MGTYFYSTVKGGAQTCEHESELVFGCCGDHAVYLLNGIVAINEVGCGEDD